MKRWIHSTTDSEPKFLLKDLYSNAYYAKSTTGEALTYDRDLADRFDTRQEVIDFGNDYFDGSFLYGRDWMEYRV